MGWGVDMALPTEIRDVSYMMADASSRGCHSAQKVNPRYAKVYDEDTMRTIFTAHRFPTFCGRPR